MKKTFPTLLSLILLLTLCLPRAHASAAPIAGSVGGDALSGAAIGLIAVGRWERTAGSKIEKSSRTAPPPGAIPTAAIPPPPATPEPSPWWVRAA